MLKWVALAVGCCLAVAAPTSPQAMSAPDAYRVHNMLREAYETVKKHYYDAKLRGLDWDARYREYDEKLKSAPSLNAGVTLIAAFLGGLHDSHTYFQPPTRPYRLDYGYRLALVGDTTFVTRVRPGTDAEGKVKPGDRLVALNGTPVTRENFAERQYALNTLAPQSSTRLTLKDVTGLDRDVVVSAKVVPGRRLHDLTGAGAGMDLADLIRDEENGDHLMRQQYVELGDVMIWKMPVFLPGNSEIDRLFGIARKHSTLILDLRENPGGLIETLRRMVGGVFDHDIEIASRVTRQGRAPMTARTRGSAAFGGKLIVLVDSGSMSSAELLARVIQLERRGTVLGDRSAGAVMEAAGYPFSQGDEVLIFYAFLVTDADLVMKDGHSLEGSGVTPDEIVLPTAQDLAAGRDVVLARAAQLAGLSLDAAAAGKLFPFEWRPF
jgi:carboxyl-terminal processing protease